MGDPDGCRAILASVIKPRDAFFQAPEALDVAAAELYELERATVLLRMVVDAQTFVPTAGPVERLTADDIEDLNRLYQLGFRAGFAQAILDDAVYYGIRIRGRLVSAAGTHVISRREGIAVVGNVMTHADYRGHGFARMVTGAVTADLLEQVPDVALNVHADNGPAIAAYSKLGYREHRRLTERLGRRRSGGWGLMRPLREAMRITWPRDQR
jgi:predicted GNAT family acetyltransferase